MKKNKARELEKTLKTIMPKNFFPEIENYLLKEHNIYLRILTQIVPCSK